MKKAKIYVQNEFAGLLTEDEYGYSFCYDKQYLNKDDADAVSLTLPLQAEEYHSNILFPFFDGLIPEGWLLEFAGRSWKIDQRDRMSLLLACCKDCIGNVSVIPIENRNI
jgi:serine/threonine-protein kinase HipA